jgi:dipeptidase
MMTWSDDAAFWIFNQVSNLVYTRYGEMIGEVRAVQQELEAKFLESTPAIDQAAAELHRASPERAVEFLTEYSVEQGDETARRWRRLYQQLFMKYMDGNVKTPDPPHRNPKVVWPGYSEAWYRRIIAEKGEHFRVPQP